MLNRSRFSTLVISIELLVCVSVYSQAPDDDNIPEVVRRDLGQPQFEKRYKLSSSLNPFYLRGDFDGDGLPDYAFLITASKDAKRGIAVWLSSQRKARFQILGAGVPFQYGADKFDNLDFDAWQVYGRKRVGRGASDEKQPRLIGEAILVEVKESASGLIYWNGRAFAWYQRGD